MDLENATIANADAPKLSGGWPLKNAPMASGKIDTRPKAWKTSSP